MDQVGAQALPKGTGFDWTAMSFQEKAVGNQTYYIFGFAILLVYLVLAGQYESWILPFAVILAVPLALFGTVAGLNSRARTTISTPRSASSCSSRSAARTASSSSNTPASSGLGMTIVDAAVEAARLRFRPIVMTSFAFILGVLPLVLATGAGAAARRSMASRCSAA